MKQGTENMRNVRVNYLNRQNMNNLETLIKFGLLKIVILLFPLFSNGQEKISADLLKDFKWTNSNFDDCTRYYKFKENGYFEHWNCSMEELDTGRFEIHNDTLMIYEYHLKSQVPVHLGGEEGTEIRYQYNYILKDGFLCLVYYRDFEYNYESFDIDSGHRYIRDKKIK